MRNRQTIRTRHWTWALIAVLASAGGATAADLTANRTVTNLSGRSGGREMHRVYVPAGARRLEVVTWGGQGDLDVYVRHGSRPTQWQYDDRSVGKATDEHVVVDNPAAGWWYIGLHGYRDYRGVSLEPRLTGGGGGGGGGGHHGSDVLRDGQPVGNLGGTSGQALQFRVEVPRGTRSLEIVTEGGRGDADLFLRHGAEATVRNFDHRSTGKWTAETITVARPEAGTWHVTLYGYQSFSGVTLTANLDGGAVQPPVLRRLVLLSPSAGDRWELGGQYEVRWRAGRGVRRVKLLYSLDDGRTWQDRGMPAAIDASDGRHTLRIPSNRDFLSDTVRIRIVDLDRAGVADTSGRLSIRPGSGHDDDRVGADFYENDNSADDANPIGLTETQLRTLHGRGDEDWVRFQPHRAGTYYLHVPDADMPLSVEVYEFILNRGLRRVQSVALRSGSVVRLQSSRNSRGFMIRVQGRGANAIGHYRLAVRAGRGYQPVVLRADRWETDNALGQEKSIPVNRAQEHTLHTRGDVDRLIFEPGRARTYYLKMTTDVTLEVEAHVFKGGRWWRLGKFNVNPGRGVNVPVEISRAAPKVVLQIEAANRTGTGTYSVEMATGR